MAVASFQVHSSIRSAANARLGRFELSRSDGTALIVDTPGSITSTSRGVIPHLSRDLVALTPSVHWVHVPFESFLERNPLVPTLQRGSHPLHTFLGFPEARHVLSATLRDPLDMRELPPNGNGYLSAHCIRGVRKVTPAQYLSYIHSIQPDLVFALSDIPFTLPPFSQKRLIKSNERSIAWLADILRPQPELHHPTSASMSHHPLNIIVHMAGDISEPARMAFAASLTETLYGREAERVKPFKCLNDGVFGYSFDLVPLRTSILASQADSRPEERQKVPPHGPPQYHHLTNPQTHVILPSLIPLIHASVSSLPPSKPRIATGASTPHEILHLVLEGGIDLFESGWAQKAADWGVALDFAFPAPVTDLAEKNSVEPPRVREDGNCDIGHNLYDSRYANDFSRFAAHFLDGQCSSQTEHDVATCPCIACSPVSPAEQLIHSAVDVLAGHTDDMDVSTYEAPFSRAYIHHLLHTHEMSAHALLVAHNLAVVDAFFTSIRRLLHAEHNHGAEVFASEVARFDERYDSNLRVFAEAKRDWIGVDRARGKGRLAREKAKQAETELATEAEAKEVSSEAQEGLLATRDDAKVDNNNS